MVVDEDEGAPLVLEHRAAAGRPASRSVAGQEELAPRRTSPRAAGRRRSATSTRTFTVREDSSIAGLTQIDGPGELLAGVGLDRDRRRELLRGLRPS